MMGLVTISQSLVPLPGVMKRPSASQMDLRFLAWALRAYYKLNQARSPAIQNQTQSRSPCCIQGYGLPFGLNQIRQGIETQFLSLTSKNTIYFPEFYSEHKIAAINALKYVFSLIYYLPFSQHNLLKEQKGHISFFTIKNKNQVLPTPSLLYLKFQFSKIGTKNNDFIKTRSYLVIQPQSATYRIFHTTLCLCPGW